MGYVSPSQQRLGQPICHQLHLYSLPLHTGKFFNGHLSKQTKYLILSFTLQVDKAVDEEYLRNVFAVFGNMMDVAIKETIIDPRTNSQSGYGFIHFTPDSPGMHSAFQAVASLDNTNVDGVVYNVEVSKNLLKQFQQQQMQQQHRPSFQHQMMISESTRPAPLSSTSSDSSIGSTNSYSSGSMSSLSPREQVEFAMHQHTSAAIDPSHYHASVSRRHEQYHQPSPAYRPQVMPPPSNFYAHQQHAPQQSAYHHAMSNRMPQAHQHNMYASEQHNMQRVYHQQQFQAPSNGQQRSANNFPKGLLSSQPANNARSMEDQLAALIQQDSQPSSLMNQKLPSIFDFPSSNLSQSRYGTTGSELMFEPAF